MSEFRMGSMCCPHCQTWHPSAELCRCEGSITASTKAIADLIDKAKPAPMVSELKPVACPFCGSLIKRVKSWARSFTPPRLCHEYHHPCECRRVPAMLWAGEAGTPDEMNFLASWNTRAPDPEALEAAFRLGLEAAAGVANAAKGNWADCARRFPDTTTIAASAEAAEVIADAILAIDPAQHLSKPCSCGSVLGYNHAGICKHCGADPAQHLGRE